jgi:hypothetical protein
MIGFTPIAQIPLTQFALEQEIDTLRDQKDNQE